ncbi:MAG TPA: S41 family peptidase [Ignavibacteriaceae bacterium]|nr:S41 family peptidase [Ignavibacteriaceae bacterium]
MRFTNAKKVLASFIILLLFSGFFAGKNDIYFEISKNIDLFSKVYKEISFNYVEQIDPEQFMRAGINGMLETLDPYTIFIDENKKDDIELITNGKYGGIGISIGIRGDNVTIVEVMDGYSSQRQGIRIGDIIIEANGVGISPENVEQISSLVKGEPGTKVVLKVLRNDGLDTLKFNLIREEIKVKSLIYYGFYPQKSNNVYLKLSNFSRSAGDEIKKALIELKSKRDIKSIILDLRGNPGGLLDVAVDICNKFLSKGSLVVTTRGRNETDEKKYYASQEPMLLDSRLAILIDGGSASASEIVAGAIQDHDRGILLGTKSYGKGLVQTITPLDYNTSLKVTTAKYYTPSGRCIQKIDYTKNNKVYAVPDSIIKGTFNTDNKRIVYSGGGITPDTTISYYTEGNITKDLLAKGIFFTFADHYYYLNPKVDFSRLNDNEMFAEFEKYLKKENYIYHSEAEKELDKLIANVNSRNIEGAISAELDKIKKEFDKLDLSELKIYKDEVTRELKAELASRYLGADSRIEEYLEYDKQFQAAIKILSDSVSYNNLLK